MCEHCRDPEFAKAERIDPASRVACEWRGDDGAYDATCDAVAAVNVRDACSNGHHCVACRTLVERALHRGARAVDSAPVSESYDEFLPIPTGENCERCGAPAGFAWVTDLPFALCLKHSQHPGRLPVRSTEASSEFAGHARGDGDAPSP